MLRIRPRYAMLLAALALVIPASAGYQQITINGTDGFDPTAVGTFVTKFEGELHTLDITVVDTTVELDVTTENPTNGLWEIETTRPNGATFRLADGSANQDHSSRFIFKQKTRGGGGGGGGGGGNKTYEAISQQIQIFASFPGQPEIEVPRPTKQGDEYFGIVIPKSPSSPVRIRLVYNREQYDEFYPSTISLEIASGLKIINRPAGQDDAASIAASLLPGSEVTFDVIHDSARIPVLTAPQPITLTLTDQFGAIHEDKVSLGPLEVESMDRYLAGSIPKPFIDCLGGESKFGLIFRNSTTGEAYSFNKLSEAHIYDDPFGATVDDEDKFLSNTEIAAWANGPGSSSKELTQDVVFYREDGKLHFRSLFDRAGQIEIGLIKDGEEIGHVKWTLTPDVEVADLLETVDSILSGKDDDDGGVILAAIQAGVSEDDLLAMRITAANIRAQGDGGGFGGFFRRNLTIKVNIPTWKAIKDNFEQGVRMAGAAVDRAITIATFAGKGFCEGAWYGVKDDATSLVELGKMILNPAETAKTFYEGFKVLIDLDLQGWKNVGKTLVESFLKKGEEGVGEWSEPNALDVASYLVGFTAGYITEQIVVTYVTAGILKAGNVGAKIGQFIRNAAKGLKTALAPVTEAAKIFYQKALKAKNSIFRRFSQDVSAIEDVKALKRMVHEMTLSCPVPN